MDICDLACSFFVRSVIRECTCFISFCLKMVKLTCCWFYAVCQIQLPTARCVAHCNCKTFCVADISFESVVAYESRQDSLLEKNILSYVENDGAPNFIVYFSPLGFKYSYDAWVHALGNKCGTVKVEVRFVILSNESWLGTSCIIATSPLALRWMRGSPRTRCTRRASPIYMWHEQAIIEWSWHVIFIVACCHSVKLCALAARAFRSQQYI